MAVPEIEKPSLAVDSNFLFDLAAEEDFALDFLEVVTAQGCRLFVPPTVVQELAHWAPKDPLALRALRKLRSWRIEPFDLVGVGHGITEGFAELLIRRGWLPPREKHDGEILAETALRHLDYLITSDTHILQIESENLKGAFKERDLDPVQPVRPKTFLRLVR
jgi:predicted nucleic acid-binding protein